MTDDHKPRFTATPLRLSDLPTGPELFDHGHRWGNWLLDANRLCLCAVRDGVDDPEANFYEIDLETITGVYWMVDWLQQIEEKGWADADVLGNLTIAFLQLYAPRSNMRDSGTKKVIDPAQILQIRKPIR